MIRFENIEYLYLLGCIPILILFFIAYRRWQRKSLLRFSTTNLIHLLSKNNSTIRKNIKYICKLSAILCIIMGLSNPILETNWKEVQRKGIEVIIAIDVSNSMLCEDFKPSRLERAKQDIHNLISKIKNDLIGLVVFAGEAYTKIPITTDYSLVQMKLSTINPSSIKAQGTNISSALQQSIKSFDFNNKLNKAIILITDGENHEEGVLEEVKKAAELGVFIYTLSMGNKDGGGIPRYPNSNKYKEYNNNPIITKPNNILLSEISNIANGIHVIADPIHGETGIRKIYNHINKIEQNKITEIEATSFTSTFQYLLFIAFMLIFLDLIILEKKNEIFKLRKNQ